MGCVAYLHPSVNKTDAAAQVEQPRYSAARIESCTYSAGDGSAKVVDEERRGGKEEKERKLTDATNETRESDWAFCGVKV